MRTFVYPYKIGSDSALKIADGLQCLRLKVDSDYNPRPNDLIINWGSGFFPKWDNGVVRWLNNTVNVAIAADKLESFIRLTKNNVSCPEWTIDKEVAKAWTQKYVVLARTKLNGHSGQGIVVCDKGTVDFPDAPLYVKYKKKAAEFRVHVFQGNVIDYQQKKKRADYEGKVDSKIRSFDNGWVFCREQVEVPQQVFDVAVQAVGALGLDFGAVDMIWNGFEQRAYALEVNTAPGLEGETMFSYVIAFLNYMETL